MAVKLFSLAGGSREEYKYARKAIASRSVCGYRVSLESVGTYLLCMIQQKSSRLRVGQQGTSQIQFSFRFHQIECLQPVNIRNIHITYSH